MSLLDAFGINVQADVTKRLNEITVEYAASAASDCFNAAKQNLSLLIERSQVNVSGDFTLTQEAKLAFSCIQEQENATELLQELEDRMKKTLKQEIDKGGLISVGQANVSVSKTDLQTIVDNSVKLDISAVCKATVDQNVDIKITGSELTLGCNTDQVRIAADLCKSLNPSIPGIAENCKAVARCLTQRSNFLVGQGLEFTSACEQVQNIAATIAQKVVQVAEIEQTQESTTRGFADFIWYIVIGVVVLGVITAIVGYFSKKQQARQQYAGYRPMPQYAPEMAGQYAGTSYSSASASRFT